MIIWQCVDTIKYLIIEKWSKVSYRIYSQQSFFFTIIDSACALTELLLPGLCPSKSFWYNYTSGCPFGNHWVLVKTVVLLWRIIIPCLVSVYGKLPPSPNSRISAFTDFVCEWTSRANQLKFKKKKRKRAELNGGLTQMRRWSLLESKQEN